MEKNTLKVRLGELKAKRQAAEDFSWWLNKIEIAAKTGEKYCGNRERLKWNRHSGDDYIKALGEFLGEGFKVTREETYEGWDQATVPYTSVTWL